MLLCDGRKLSAPCGRTSIEFYGIGMHKNKESNMAGTKLDTVAAADYFQNFTSLLL